MANPRRRITSRAYKKWEKLVRSLKKSKRLHEAKIDNPWALAHYIQKHEGRARRQKRSA